MANKILNYIMCATFVAFGLGGGLEGGRNGNGFIIIEFYEKEPNAKPITITSHGIHLFTVEF